MIKKSILLMGSTGFIGKNIYECLVKNPNFKIYRYSSIKKKFIDNVDIKKFDILIFASGIHKQSNYSKNDIFLDSKKNIKSLITFIDDVDKIIFISSFKTSFNSAEDLIDEHTKYNFYHHDSYYGKSKILAEKIFLYLCNLKKKKFVILSPTHVIGPEKENNSINNSEIRKIHKKFLIFYPDCLISLTDVRNISTFIELVISSNSYDNKKIILNDISIKYIDYIKKIKKNKFFLSLKITKKILHLIFLLQSILLKFKIIRYEFVNKSQIEYIRLNPKIKTTLYEKKISFDKTIRDVKDQIK